MNLTQVCHKIPSLSFESYISHDFIAILYRLHPNHIVIFARPLSILRQVLYYIGFVSFYFPLRVYKVENEKCLDGNGMGSQTQSNLITAHIRLENTKMCQDWRFQNQILYFHNCINVFQVFMSNTSLKETCQTANLDQSAGVLTPLIC